MSDNELDAELLAMAGDGSDDEGEEMESPQHAPVRTPSPEAKQSVEKVEDSTASRKGVAQKVRARGRRKRKQSEEEDDLVDGSQSPPDSPRSAAMDHADSDVDAPASPDVDEGPLFPLEGKYYSTQDRNEILAMPEIERETILAERAALVARKQQDAALQKTLAQATSSKNKRKAAAAGLVDDEKRSTRPKAEKSRTALDDYKRARELKGTERGRLDTGRDQKGEHSASPTSDRDADGESEVEWAEPTSEPRRDDVAAEIKDFERCRVGRSNFAKVCFYPSFESTVKGCFCRVSIGVNRETGQNQYRMAQIKGFTEGRPYQLELPNGKHFTTDQYAIVAQGTAEKPWPFAACSDSRFTDAEFDRFTATLRKENMRVPGRKFLNAKLDDIHALINTNWTDDQISAKLAKQKAMELKHDPVHATRVKREAIIKRKIEAEDSGDIDEIEKCDAELAALDYRTSNSTSNGVASKLKVSPAAVKNGSILSQQDRLAQLNLKNRTKTSEDVRKALLEEKRRIAAARDKARADAEAAQKAAEEESKRRLLGVPKQDMSDLFGEGSDISRAGTPGTPRRSRPGTPLNGMRKEKSGGLGGLIKKKNLDDDVIGAMDLGIDLEI